MVGGVESNDKSGRFLEGIEIRYFLMNAGYRFLLLVVGYALWMGAAEKPPFLLRIHLQATEGAKGMVSVPVTLFQPNETIAIQSLPEVTEKEIRKVATRLDGTVLVEFDDFGRTKLEVGTSTGRGMILVVLVNGRVVYAPRIDTVITNGSILLPPGSITPDEILQINGEVEKRKEQRLKDVPRPN
jgi:hypothetical protein